ncbi:MAG: CehA/McbA family metallohydrolase [Nitriliruptorales bacterium]
MISRRDLLHAVGAGGLSAVLPTRMVSQRPQRADDTLTLTTTVAGTGYYAYLPFDVPAGVDRIDVTMRHSQPAKLGVGLFDWRGAGYQSSGFRGVYGDERSDFFVATDVASPSFLPGPIQPGTWTVIVPVFQAPPLTVVTVTVTLRSGLARGAFRPDPIQGVVRDAPGWYRGDLHCHTPESSDAWATGSAMTAAEWAATCRRIGLDFVALTDHNVVSQNLHLARDAEPGVLFLAGEEMTNWFHGHATVSGLLDPTGWLDWRQRPLGVPTRPNEGRIIDFLRTAHQLGAYVSAAHPMLAHVAWQFFTDAVADRAARPDGIEVWSGQFRPDSEATLKLWDGLLREGWRIPANGGSDLHGTDNPYGLVAGTPTTVVYAERLERGALVDALRAGRSYITRVPDGVELELGAEGPGGQHERAGAVIYGAAADLAHVELIVRRAAGMRLIVTVGGQQWPAQPITEDSQTFTLRVPIAAGYVRAEVRSLPEVPARTPLSGRTDMEALTNPIYLRSGRSPDGS